MKKIIYLLITLLTFSGFAYSMEIQGGVKYDVDSAREYVQEGQSNYLKFSGHEYFNKNDKGIKKVVYSYNPSGDIIGITVQYKDEPILAYIFGSNNNLRFVDKYDRDTSLFPHRGYRYDLNGQLILTSLTVSNAEQFRFSPDGKLIAHSINNVTYDENGNIIGRSSK